ncbi:hypothetical protein [Sulfurirhabdus autotrophica]|uniref:Lipoprotein n=1 Tax=Sulfurirhabdus autotrophica TaxID=1706046 RepID=A0A4R3Y6M7_9PROT|nr:hypothetical protein [Sulfurirhabdus autotrophica]TCV85873.1 hypothetical protein EDC63_10881 [Sulfurirhabdus autotrophica]
MRNLKFTVALFTTLTLFGCESLHHFTINPREPGASGQGVAYGFKKTVEISLNGNTYSGTFVLDAGRVKTYISNSTATLNTNASATSGNNTVYGTGFGQAYGTTVGNTFEQGSGNGRLLATNAKGDAIRCEFTVNLSRHGTGLGVCQDNAGKQYDMVVLD